MQARLLCGAIVVLMLVALGAPAQQPTSASEVTDLLPVQGKEKEPKEKTKPPVEAKEPPPDVFAQSAPESAEASRGLNPHTISDPLGYFTLRTIMLPSSEIIKTFQNVTTFQTVTTLQTVTTFKNVTIIKIIKGVAVPITIQLPVITQVPVQSQVPVTTQMAVTLRRPTVVTTTTRVPVLGLGAFKISENQSPMPEDRAFLTYNYFNGARGPGGSFASPSTISQQTTFNGFPATITTAVPAAPPPRLDIHRGVFGFEKSFLDGSASFGVRVPVFDGHGDNFSQSDIGDVTVFLNYAFYRDAAGNVLSGGLAVTVPTGPRVDSVEGNIHPVLLQPFVGYRLNLDRFYLQGFTSIAVPTDSVAVTALFNDVGVGYYLYRGDGERFITALIPTVEAHITTPLNHRHATDAFTIPDLVDLTAGMHIGLGSRSLLTVGVTTPVTGPRPWNVEAVAQFNLRF